MRERPSVNRTEQLPDITLRLIIAITKTDPKLLSLPQATPKARHAATRVQPVTLQTFATAKAAKVEAVTAWEAAVAATVLATADATAVVGANLVVAAGFLDSGCSVAAESSAIHGNWHQTVS
ncbi:MAG TPA: hypothetical protein VM260_23725, partial [Pirellula sp.]|nr:hypothetical protein [Pirellula sp.]